MASGASVCIDANVWIAYFDLDDSLSSKACALLDQVLASEQHFIITTLVIQEALTVFLYSAKPKAAKLFLDFIEQHPLATIVVCDFDMIQKSIAYAERARWKPKLSLTDWSLLYGASVAGYTLLTFDRQLSNALTRMKTSIK